MIFAVPNSLEGEVLQVNHSGEVLWGNYPTDSVAAADHGLYEVRGLSDFNRRCTQLHHAYCTATAVSLTLIVACVAIDGGFRSGLIKSRTYS